MAQFLGNGAKSVTGASAGANAKDRKVMINRFDNRARFKHAAGIVKINNFFAVYPASQRGELRPYVFHKRFKSGIRYNQ